jgi:hypothetical protein
MSMSRAGRSKEPGGYEARAYAKNNVYTDSNVVGTVKFSVR